MIETQTAKFWADMQQVDSVGTAHKTHQLYIDTMTAHAFLDEASIMSAVSTLLNMARQLYASVQVSQHCMLEAPIVHSIWGQCLIAYTALLLTMLPFLPCQDDCK